LAAAEPVHQAPRRLRAAPGAELLGLGAAGGGLLGEPGRGGLGVQAVTAIRPTTPIAADRCPDKFRRTLDTDLCFPCSAQRLVASRQLLPGLRGQQRPAVHRPAEQRRRTCGRTQGLKHSAPSHLDRCDMEIKDARSSPWTRNWPARWKRSCPRRRSRPCEWPELPASCNAVGPACAYGGPRWGAVHRQGWT
jgi:hypothetical protein